MTDCACGQEPCAEVEVVRREGSRWVVLREVLVAVPLTLCADLVGLVGFRFPESIAQAQEKSASADPDEAACFTVCLDPRWPAHAEAILDALGALGWQLGNGWHGTVQLEDRKVLAVPAVPCGESPQPQPTRERMGDVAAALKSVHHTPSAWVSEGEG